jgi:hypothetical protein
MASPEYQPVPGDEEKYQIVAVSNRRLSSSSLDATLSYDEPFEKRRSSILKWIWVIHAVLLSVSSTMFAAAYFKPVSTLEHVRHFSAYCQSSS